MKNEMPREQTRKQQSHERIVTAAARAIRAHGYAGVGVAGVMQEAGLTHGGFYAHFPSRDALLVAAIEEAGRSSAASIQQRVASPDGQGAVAGPIAFRAFVESYLSDKLLKTHDAGCPVAALCSEMPRQSDEVRKASAARVRALVRLVDGLLPNRVHAEEAGVVAATLVGSLQMARALDGTAGRALLATTRDTLIARYAPDR